MGLARNLSRGNREIQGQRPRVGKRFLERGQQAKGSGGALLAPPAGFDCFGCTKSPENASSGHKCCLVPISRFDSAEPLDAIGRTPVEIYVHWGCAREM